MADYVRAGERAAKAIRSAGVWVAEVLAVGVDEILDLIFGPVPTDRVQALGPYEYPEFFADTRTPDASADMLRGAADDTAAGIVQPAPAACVDPLAAVQPADRPWLFEPSLTVDEVRALRIMIDERFPLQACSAPVEPSPSPGVPGAEPLDWRARLEKARTEPCRDCGGRGLHVCEPGSSADSAAPEFDWVTWVIPAITEVLADHKYLPATGTCVTYGDTCIERLTSAEWREHVAPIIAARIHLAASQQ